MLLCGLMLFHNGVTILHSNVNQAKFLPTYNQVKYLPCLLSLFHFHPSHRTLSATDPQSMLSNCGPHSTLAWHPRHVNGNTPAKFATYSCRKGGDLCECKGSLHDGAGHHGHFKTSTWPLVLILRDNTNQQQSNQQSPNDNHASWWALTPSCG